jgi:hypothetical protein
MTTWTVCGSPHEGFVCLRPRGHGGKHRHSSVAGPSRRDAAIRAATATRLCRYCGRRIRASNLGRHLDAQHPADR